MIINIVDDLFTLLNTGLLFVLESNLDQSRLEGISSFAGELAGRDSMLEHEIQLRVGESLGLRKTEVSPNDEEDCNSGPEEATLSTPVPVVLSDHLGHDVVCEEDDGVV